MFAIIDYGLGNLHSVANAFEFIGCSTQTTSKAEDLRRADAIILPGVGAFADGVKNLLQLGLVKALEEEVLRNQKPFLGICLGMQLLAEDSSEGGLHKGLGFLPGRVRRLSVGKLRLPHIGWNNIEIKAEEPLFQGMEEDRNFYFVHSYHFIADRASLVSATCGYGHNFAAAVQRDNIFAVQFHPEKSHKNGLRLLRNFAGFVEKNKKK